MKTWICNTMCNFYAPLLGTARLYAYTKKQGHDVVLHDFNQDTYFTLLSREYLEPVMDKTSHLIDAIFRNGFFRKDMGSIVLESSGNAMRQMVARGMLRKTPWDRVINGAGPLKRPLFGMLSSRIKPDNMLVAMLSEKDYVLTGIERSRKVLDERFYTLAPEEFLRHFQTLLCGKALIDMVYFPAQLDFGLGFQGAAFNPTASDILRGVTDEKLNFLIPYYRRKVMPLLEKEQPEVVGLSMTCIYEVIPVFTLANMIKKTHPDIHVTLGGVLPTQMARRLANNPSLWGMFDSVVLGPGEVVFSELIERIEKGTDISAVPNIIYRQNGSIKSSEQTHEFDLNDACTPEFVDVRPASGLPLETSSGCYWGKCIFCYYPKAGTADRDASYQKKRVRNIELVLKDIRELQDRYNPCAVALTDSSVHPKRLEAIAEDNLRTGRKIPFSALFRLEKEFQSKAFCRKLAEGGFLGGYVGLESGSQRVNEIINKGIDVADSGTIIRNFYDAGILLHIFSIIGIPGETREDALMTYEFFKRWRRWITLDWVIYFLYVTEQSAIARRTEELGLEVTPLPPEYLTDVMRYKTASGLTQQEAAALSLSYTEKLRRFLHPLNQIMDIESMALFLLVQRARGIMPDKVKRPA
jgi:anaerobic magnesium-protoporphyrin IX monomethyl ester cyclase